jgi:hypothetical protein
MESLPNLFRENGQGIFLKNSTVLQDRRYFGNREVMIWA